MLLLLDNLSSMTGLECAVCVQRDKVGLRGGMCHGQEAGGKHDPWNRSPQHSLRPLCPHKPEPRLSHQGALGTGEDRKEETKSDFVFLRTVLLYKGLFSCLSFETTFHCFKLLFTASFIHPAFFFFLFLGLYESKRNPWGLHSSSFVTDTGMKPNRD